MANIDLEKLTLLYEGKAKQVYQTDDKETYIVHYTGFCIGAGYCTGYGCTAAGYYPGKN